jgi:hypothetical protein
MTCLFADNIHSRRICNPSKAHSTKYMKTSLFIPYSNPRSIYIFVLSLCTTGTELGGRLPYSVMTMLMY